MLFYYNDIIYSIIKYKLYYIMVTVTMVMLVRSLITNYVLHVFLISNCYNAVSSIVIICNEFNKCEY